VVRMQAMFPDMFPDGHGQTKVLLGDRPLDRQGSEVQGVRSRRPTGIAARCSVRTVRDRLVGENVVARRF